VGDVRPEVDVLRVPRRLSPARPTRLLVALAVLLSGCDEPAPAASAAPERRLPAVETEPVAHDADDPAIWVHPDRPGESLILGTDKVAAPGGALVVFGLDGGIRQRIDGLDRPNNIDVEHGIELGGEPADVAVLTERYRHRLRAFRIPRDGGPLVDVSSPTGLDVFAGEPGERSEPMGVALYRRPADGAVFALVSRKAGPEQGYLWQYRLEDDGSGRLRAVKVRELGDAAAGAEIEAVAVDDALGYVYYAEEGRGIHKWHADPDAPGADAELALLGTEGFDGDREGLAIYAPPGGGGYLVACDQLPGASRYRLFDREGPPEAPHDQRLAAVIEGGADETDGLEATAAPLGPGFPAGILVVMNSSGRNFHLHSWQALLTQP